MPRAIGSIALLAVAVLLVPSCTPVPETEAPLTTLLPATAMTGSTTPPGPITIAASSNSIDRFVPITYPEGDRQLLAVTFPDGSTAELEWPLDLDIVSKGVRPHAWGRLSDAVARDFLILYGEIEEVLGALGGAELLGRYGDVGFWRLVGVEELDYLGFQFSGWAVRVYDSSHPPRLPAHQAPTGTLGGGLRHRG